MWGIIMSEQIIEVSFSVSVTYSYEQGNPFCKESARNNLLASIENERLNGALTPDNISADHVVIEEIKHGGVGIFVLDVEMSSIVGDYDVPDEIPEWEWVEQNASFHHAHNAKSGIWDFMLNLANEHNDIPPKLLPVINSAIAKGYSYILFNQGT